MKLSTLNDDTFQEVIGQRGVTLVEFGAEWCPPCKTLLPILEELADQLDARASIYKLDCDDSPATAGTYGVMSMPTVILFKDGEPLEKLVGLRSKTVYEGLISRHQ